MGVSASNSVIKALIRAEFETLICNNRRQHKNLKRQEKKRLSHCKSPGRSKKCPKQSTLIEMAEFHNSRARIYLHHKTRVAAGRPLHKRTQEPQGRVVDFIQNMNCLITKWLNLKLSIYKSANNSKIG